MSEEYAIRVKNIRKMYKMYDSKKDRLLDALGFSRKHRYTEYYALRDVSFDVKRGETVGLIGTNGAGKSTMLKIITGVLQPTDGTLEINGRISALLELGAGFNPEYTGIENIYLNGTMMGYTKAEVDAKLQDILDFADIGDFVRQPVKNYSSGMFVRLAFAVAINIDPEILIVDEALSVGDIFFQSKCYEKFEEFKKEGKTILFVSHDLSAVSRYCDRVILLNKGEKLAEGSPKDMINLYKKILTGSLKDIHELSEKYGGKLSGEVGDDQLRAEQKNNFDGAHSITEADSVDEWRSHFAINPSLNEYGNHRAEIIDFAIVDEDGELTSTIVKGTRFQIRTKIRFNDDIPRPIFTYTFRNVRGVDITGTNTELEGQEIEMAHKGDIYVVTYEQEMTLQGGEYLLSMSCTGFVKGNLTAYHRCYDLLSVTVVSDKNTVGFYDMESKTTITKVN
ncbi:MAG: ABC transporter ATP-binding protein [Eubacteriales bacterium]|jgi:teichoic acid transport system ATP-binding protein